MLPVFVEPSRAMSMALAALGWDITGMIGKLSPSRKLLSCLSGLPISRGWATWPPDGARTWSALSNSSGLSLLLIPSMVARELDAPG